MMTSRTIYLIASRNSPHQRAHFAIFVPSERDPETGTLIQVIGAPMGGYGHEYKRNYSPANTPERYTMWPIGQVLSSNIIDTPPEQGPSTEYTPKGNIEIAASEIPAPPKCENFLAPVNEVRLHSFFSLYLDADREILLKTTNRRCQKWTMEFLRHLVSKGLIGAEAVDIVQSKRDPPTHGISLRPVQ